MKFTYNSGDQPVAGYTIKRAIHRGGFGEVYYAQSEAGKDVALKLLHENHEVELRGVRQCLNLKHPQLVTIFDIKTDAHNDYWVVMEYVGGETLAEKIQQHPQGLPLEQIEPLFDQICAGLQFMHARNLVHRDLKPANIFVEGEQVKIGDIGLSKFIGPSRRSAHTQSVGTVHYMAPEIAKGNYGVGVDIYALGIILYEMLTGRVPFEGESTAEILMKHLAETPDIERLPPSFRQVVKKALEKQAELRYQSADEFAVSFQNALSDKQEDFKADAASPFSNRREPFPDPSAKSQASLNFPQVSAVPRQRSKQHRWGTLLMTAAFLMIGLFLTRAGYLRGFIPGMIFSGVILIFWYRFHRSTGVAAPETHHVSSHPVVKPQHHIQSFKPPARPAQHLIKWLHGLLMTPVVLAFITGSIALLSANFFGSVIHPNQVDLAQLGFFYFSTVLLCWILQTGTRLVAIRNRVRKQSSHGSRLLFAILGFTAGMQMYTLQEYLLVQFPESQFNSQSPGMIENLGDQPLAVWKVVGPVNETDEVKFLENKNHEEQIAAETAIVTPTSQMKVSHNPETSFQVSPEVIVQETEPSSGFSVSTLKSFLPTWMGYGMFFGFFFGLRNWSAVVSETRDTRLQWFSIAVSIGTAYLICCLLTFPTIWAMTWAAAMTATLQLTSPFINE